MRFATLTEPHNSCPPPVLGISFQTTRKRRSEDQTMFGRLLGAACVAALFLSMTGLAAGREADARLADAAMKGDRTAVRALLKEAADVNAPAADGTTALHW